MELTSEQRAELAALVNRADVSASVATRARIVLWRADGRPKVEVAALAGVSRPTVDLWLSRFAAAGVSGLLDRRRGAPREQMSAAIRGRVLALTRTSPPAETGLSHWSSRELAAFITRTEGVYVSHHYVAKLWRETGLKPHRHGTFKVSKDPEFAAKVADVVGLYMDPPGGAVVLSIDEKTRAPRGADSTHGSKKTIQHEPQLTQRGGQQPAQRAEHGAVELGNLPPPLRELAVAVAMPT